MLCTPDRNTGKSFHDSLCKDFPGRPVALPVALPVVRPVVRPVASARRERRKHAGNFTKKRRRDRQKAVTAFFG